MAVHVSSAHADDSIRIDVQGDPTAGFSTRITAEDKPRDLGDAAGLLEGVPGIRVRRLGAEGAFSTLSLRGSASNQVALRLAAVPLTGAADPSVDLGTLPLFPFTQVRVYRTFAPASLGGGYLGGLVEIEPLGRVLPGQSRTEVMDRLGAFGAYAIRIADLHSFGGDDLDHGDQPFSVASGLTASRAENNYVYVDPDDGLERVRQNARFSQVSGMVSARYDVRRLTILASVLAQARRDGIAGAVFRPTIAVKMARDRELASVELRSRDDLGRTRAVGWVRREGRIVDDRLAELSGVARSSSAEVLAGGVTFGRTFRLAETRLETTLDPSVESQAGALQRRRVGVSLDAEVTNPSRIWAISAAARVDLFHDESATVSTSQWLPAFHLGASFRPFSGTSTHPFASLTLASHVGLLGRAPSFLELLGDGGVFQGAPGLQPERAWAADLGANYLHSFGKLSVATEFAAFVSRTRDLILVLPTGLATQRAANVGAAWSSGFELSLSAQAYGLRGLVSYTFLHTRDATDDPTTRGAPLPGRPAHDLTFDLSAQIGRMRLNYGLDVVDKTTLDRAGLRQLPTRVFHNLGVSLEGKSVLIRAEVANLFDQRSSEVVLDAGPPVLLGRSPQSDFLGYPLPGRRGSISVKFSH